MWMVWPLGLPLQAEGNSGRKEEEISRQGQQVYALAK